MFKKVTETEFYNFINNYPTKLEPENNFMAVLPIKFINDFEKNIIVGKIEPRSMEDQTLEYYLNEEIL